MRERLDHVGDPPGGTGSALGNDAARGIATCEVDIAREQTRRALFPALRLGQPRSLGRFVVLRAIGRGAMGAVYSAHDPRLDRTVALKVLTARRADLATGEHDPGIEEARALAHVAHANVVKVYGVGEVARSGGRPLPYIAMELIEGSTLQEHVRTQRPDWREILRLYREAGRGLAAVHAAALVHRDFKPSNVMLDSSGRVRVMDFGLAHRGGVDTPDSSSTAAGTPAYMAPEILQGSRATPLSDQWSFCVSVYEALFGARPWSAKTLPELLREIIETKQRPRLPRSSLPRKVADALRRGLSPRPSERWPSMDDLVSALEPAERPRFVFLAAAGVAVAGLAWAGAPAPAAACDDPASAFDAAWSAERRSALAATLSAGSTDARAGTTARAVAAFSDYAGRWTTEYADACGALQRASGGDARREDRRMECLVRARERATALGDELLTLEGAHRGAATSAVQGLRAPEACVLQTRAGAPRRNQGPRHEALRQRLDRLSARHQLGLVQGLREHAAQATQAAQELRDGELSAVAALTYGRILMDFSHRDPARVELERAFFLGQEAESPSVAVDAALELARINATQDSAFDAAWHWWRTAEGFVTRIDLDSRRDRLEALRIEIMYRDGRRNEATEAATALLVRLESGCVSPCEVLPVAHGLLSLLYQSNRRFNDALFHSERRIELWRSRYGDAHPETLSALQVKAEVLASAGRNEPALEAIESAEAGTIAIFGGDSLRTANVQAVKATVLLGLGRTDHALTVARTVTGNITKLDEPWAEAMLLSRIAQVHAAAGQTTEAHRANLRAVELMEGLFPGGHPELPVLRSNVALDAYSDGDYEAALRGFTRALNSRRELVAAYDPGNQVFLNNIGSALRRLGRNEEAIAAFEEGIELTRSEALTKPIVTGHAMLWRVQHRTDPEAAARVREAIEARCAAEPPDVQKAADCDYVNRVVADARDE